MSELPHFRLEGREKPESYVYTGVVVRKPFKRPTRNQPIKHAKSVHSSLSGIGGAVKSRREAEARDHPALLEHCAGGVILTFRSAPEYGLPLDKLDRDSGIKFVGTTKDGEVEVARVFVPTGKEKVLLRVIDRYTKSKALTYLGDPEDKEKLIALQDPDNGVKHRPPVREKKVEGEDKITVKFIVDSDKVAAFKKTVGDQAVLLKESRENDELIESIASVSLAVIEEFWQDPTPFPARKEKLWWEVWLIGSRKTAEEDHWRFVEVARGVGISKVSDVYVAFPERVVVHAWASAEQLSVIDILALIADLRRGKELASEYADMTASEQREFIDSLRANLNTAAGEDPPAVCILDAGVNRPHPLLEGSLAEDDQHAALNEWAVSDHHPQQHGTGMAGIALYGCLTEALSATGKVELRHILESVKIMPPSGKNEAPDYGRRMQDGVAKAQAQAGRRNRALCMAVTSDDYENGGRPSLWSGAIDDMCFGLFGGPKSLMLVSAGNMRKEILLKDYVYHEWNRTRGGIEDPGQSWNALTVGACTERIDLRDKSLQTYTPVASSGDLCPTSRTSLAWRPEMRDDWPIKPDFVMEGGNYARKNDAPMSCDDLSLLTTIIKPGRLLTTMLDTSPATALAARMAATIWSHHPTFWPETVRALMVHSARWTKAMRDRIKDNTKGAAMECLRCHGYGVPDLQRALYSAKDAVTMIFQGELKPYQKGKKKNEVNMHHMHVHPLPWPIRALQDLRDEKVTMRVTLSYFVEPSPGSVNWKVNNRYASHGLRFDVLRPTESVDGFKRRLSKAFWSSLKRPTNAKDTRVWTVGEDNRTLGSVHSDWWTGTATELAASGSIIVYPVSGWWKERGHLEKHDSIARYSLIVSIRSRKKGLDLYGKIENLGGVVKTEVMV